MIEPMTSLLPLWRQLTWWALAFPVVMIVAIARHDVLRLTLRQRSGAAALHPLREQAIAILQDPTRSF